LAVTFIAPLVANVAAPVVAIAPVAAALKRKTYKNRGIYISLFLYRLEFLLIYPHLL
jgi:hypothetical protein